MRDWRPKRLGKLCQCSAAAGRRGGPSGSVRRRGVSDHSRHWLLTSLLSLAFLLAAMGASAGGAASDYDPQEAGHPLRVAAYVLHPVGVILDTLIFRPAHWLGSQEPFKTLVGNTD